MESVGAQMSQVRQFVREGNSLLDDGKFDLAIVKLQNADSLLPNHPIILQLLSVAAAQSSNPGQAYKYLTSLGLVNASIDVLKFDVFDSLRKSEQFNEIEKQFSEINEIISLSDTAFTLEDRILHPEGIEFDPTSNTFLISSIHKGKIVRKKIGDKEEDLITENLMAASGLKIDQNRGWLWVSTGAIDEWQGYTEEVRGQSKVVKFDLESGELLEEFYAIDEERHYFGDLVLRPGSDHVYVSDSRQDALFMIDPDNERLNLVKEFDDFVSFQGLSFSDDGNTLFLADYRQGLFSMDLETWDIKPIKALPEMSLKGIDGLYYFNNSIIAIQNGVSPKRITQIYLNEDQSKIERFRYLEKANPVLDEPTLGVLVGSQFYYVANSSWPRYDQDGNIGPANLHPIPVIMKIDLQEN